MKRPIWRQPAPPELRPRPIATAPRDRPIWVWAPEPGMTEVIGPMLMIFHREDDNQGVIWAGWPFASFLWSHVVLNGFDGGPKFWAPYAINDNDERNEGGRPD